MTDTTCVLAQKLPVERRGFIIMEIELSEESKKELEEIERKIRGDMTDEEWEFFGKIRC